MIPGYALKLDLKVYSTNIKAQKISVSILEIFEIALVNFQVKDKISLTQYFYKTFLLADINLKIIIKMFFLTFSNANI